MIGFEPSAAGSVAFDGPDAIGSVFVASSEGTGEAVDIPAFRFRR